MRDQNGTTHAGGYDPAHFASLFPVEDRHFWFRARNQVISAVAMQAVEQLSPGYRVLELGCGNGNVLRFLERACPTGILVGMDLYAEGLRFARSRTSCHLVQGDVSRSPFGKPFQVIGMFDVLEHISDDRRILRNVWKLLDDRGILLLTVPAHASLWSYFDESGGHCRRYELDELRSKLEEADYQIEYLTQYMSSIYPMMWLSRRIRSRVMTGTDRSKKLLQDELRIVPVLNEILSFFLSSESKWLAKRRQLPFGTSLLAVARKLDRS
jgi:SAM-dependent methyltransferase